MKFIGAAQQPFTSFMDLARSMLDTHCHNWNNPSDSRSYILPPVYSFKNADKSDEDIHDQELLNTFQRDVIDRRSDSGEFVVFYALWKLIQDRVQAPLVAIHGLDLDNVRHHLQKIFPNAQNIIKNEFERMMREYDFILIGPKIGLIVIEVKSSHFTKARDFAENNKHLPDGIIEALKQLDSFGLSLFQVCSGVQMAQEIPIRKILFTPNLEKGRYGTWLSNLQLDEWAKQAVDRKFNGVTHWFNEDLCNQCEHDQKPFLYSTLRREFEKSGYEIPQAIFESIGLIISGLRSAVVLQSQTNIATERLSISSAILKDATALESHNPKRQRLDKNGPNVVEVESKLVLLTPDQQNALNGPNRQFIIGAPGTGKTIILQAKIAQELMEGKKVVIFAQSYYMGKYETLFNSHGSCKVFSDRRWTRYFPQLTQEFLKKRMFQDGTLRETLEKLSEHIQCASLVPEDLRDFDSIFIDDAFDSDRPSLRPQDKSSRIYESISLMAIASSSEFGSKLVWVACDSYLNDSDDEACKRLLNQIIRGEQGDYFNTAILDRVMRSSERVFQAIYSTEITQHLAKEPLVGHKIHGFYDCVHLSNLSLNDALVEIWKHTNRALEEFKEDGFDYGHMAIIIAAEKFERSTLRFYLLHKFKENSIPVEDACNDRAWDTPGLLTFDIWDNVSSFEWPVVIYIGMFEAHEKRVSAAYNRYRACSRATMKLFEIIADIEIDLEAVDIYRGDDGIYVVVFYNRPRPGNQAGTSLRREEERRASKHGGKLFKSFVGSGHWAIHKIDSKEVRGHGLVCMDFFNLISPTDTWERKYLERQKEGVPLTVDELEYFCRRGHRLDLLEFIVKAKETFIKV